MPQAHNESFAVVVNQPLCSRVEAAAITGDAVVAIAGGLELKLHSGTGGDTVVDPIDYSAVMD
jgi:hypothetical protein